MRKSRKFISMPIVSIEEGMQIGTTRGVVVNPAQMEVAALIIDQRGWFREQKIVPYGKVKNIGGDAITIDQSSQVQKTTSLPEILRLIREKVNPVGAKVIIEDGTLLGHVDEYYVDEVTGKIVTLEISGKFLDNLFKGKARLSTEHVRTMGSDIIVLCTGAHEYLEKVDGGLQDTINNLKESTSHLWASTKTKTIKLSQNIKEKAKEKSKSDKKNTSPANPGAGIELSSEPVTIIQENIEPPAVLEEPHLPQAEAEQIAEEEVSLAAEESTELTAEEKQEEPLPVADAPEVPLPVTDNPDTAPDSAEENQIK